MHRHEYSGGRQYGVYGYYGANVRLSRTETKKIGDYHPNEFAVFLRHATVSKATTDLQHNMDPIEVLDMAKHMRRQLTLSGKQSPIGISGYEWPTAHKNASLMLVAVSHSFDALYQPMVHY